VVFSAKTAVKLLFFSVLANFGFAHARVLFFVHNDFPCGTNNLRNPICLPLAVFSAKTAEKPPFF
jgi:hypothetical protein